MFLPYSVWTHDPTFSAKDEFTPTAYCTYERQARRIANAEREAFPNVTICIFKRRGPTNYDLIARLDPPPSSKYPRPVV